jgi:hypothetical protein
VCALAVLVSAISAFASFEDDYAAGLKALDQGRLTEAKEYLQRALTAHPEPVDQVMVAGNEQPYLPLHFLGVVAVRLGDCEGAANYWNGAANKRMVGRLNMVRLQEQRALANCRPADVVAKAPAPAPAPIEEPAKPVPVEPAKTDTAKPSAPEKSAKANTTPEKPAAPDALVAALQNYIAGRYTAAARIDPAALPEARARFHAYLVRAASRFMLVSTGGDASLLDAARADVRAARALDARTQPDTATFAPRFRAFYAQTQ